MKTRAILVVLVVAWLVTAAFAQVGIGDTPETVLRLHGKPTSIVKREADQIFLYPNGGRVRFVDGKVVDIKGPLPTVAVAPPPAEEKNQASAPKAAAPEAASLAEPPTPTIVDTGALQKLGDRIEKMNTAWGEMAPPEKHSPLDSIPGFLTGLLLRFGLTILALKIAFKIWTMDAFWKGILLISGIDTALHATFELLGPVTSGFTTMSAVENGIPGLVLIYTIHRFCFNKQIQNAVLTAVSVKLVVMLCNLFLIVALLNFFYGK